MDEFDFRSRAFTGTFAKRRRAEIVSLSELIGRLHGDVNHERPWRPDAMAEADDMVDPAFLAASLIDEPSPNIVQALNDMPSELAVAVLLNLPPDCAIEVQNSSR
jgi:hypothetical protein